MGNDAEDRERYSSDPGDYGVDLSVLSAQQKLTWELQERFLDAYAGRGTKATTATRVGIHRKTVQWWEDHDLHHFNERFRIAQEHFNNVLEDKALELALGLKPGQNVTPLAILMNGNMPEKYKQNNMVVVDETPKKVAAKLAQMAQEDAEERKAGRSAVTRQDNITQLEQMRAKNQT